MSQNQAMSSKYFRRQSKFWLIGAGVTAVAWLLVWLTSSAPAIIKKEQADETVSEVVLPTRIERLADLEKEVKPIDFSTLVRDMRSYPAEFKDKTYFENIANKYTVQLMDVAENDIIVNYLNGRKDRDKFAYFRYLDNDKNARYILTYGRFASSEEALSTNVDFGLPTTIQPKAVKASEYLSVIDNYLRDNSVVDLSSSQPRRIRLQATKNEIPVQAATEADEKLAQQSQAAAETQTVSNEVQTVQPPVQESPAVPSEQPSPQNNPVDGESPSTKPAPAAKPEPKAEPKPAAQGAGGDEAATAQ